MRTGHRSDPLLLDRHLVEDNWDLGGLGSSRRTDSGSSNLTFFVDSGRGAFVLRVSNDRKTEAHLAWEVALLDHLAARGFPAPQVVPTRDGRRWATIDGEHCLLTRRCPGSHADPAVAGHLDGTGAALAWFHTEGEGLPADVRPSDGPGLSGLASAGRLLDRAAVLAANSLPLGDLCRLRAAAGRLAAAAAEVTTGLATYAPLPAAVTHGSLGPSAILFDGDRLSAVLDFERAAVDTRLVDVAYMARGFCRRPGEPSLDLGRLAVLVRGYQRRAPLPEAEALPLCLQAQRLLRLRRKAANFVARHGQVPAEAKDGQKLLRIAEAELANAAWAAAQRDAILQAI